MVWQGNFDVNRAVDSGITGDSGACAYYLKEALVSAGVMSVIQSGDGITWQLGDIFSTADQYFSDPLHPVANNWSQGNCWMVLRMTGTTWEFVFWRHPTAQNLMMILFSPTGFTDNTNRTNQHPPEAADEELILGSKPSTFGVYTATSANPLYSHVGVNDEPDSDGVYSFYQFATTQSGLTTELGMFFAGVEQGIDSDPMPWLFHHSANAGNVFDYTILYSDITGPHGYRDFGGGTETFDRIPFCTFNAGATVVAPGNIPLQVDSKTRGLPIFAHSPTRNNSKGWVKDVIWKPISARSYPDTDELTDTEDTGPQIYIDDLILPWPQSVTPL